MAFLLAWDYPMVCLNIFLLVWFKDLLRAYRVCKEWHTTVKV